MCRVVCAPKRSPKTFSAKRSPKTFSATGRGTLKAFAQPQNGSAKRRAEGGGCRWLRGEGEARGR